MGLKESTVADEAADELFGDDLWLWYLFDETNGSAQFLVQNQRHRGFLLIEPDPHLLGRILSDLKGEFALMAPNMEYVEALDEDPWAQFTEFAQRLCDEDPDCEKE